MFAFYEKTGNVSYTMFCWKSTLYLAMKKCFRYILKKDVFVQLKACGILTTFALFYLLTCRNFTWKTSFLKEECIKFQSCKHPGKHSWICVLPSILPDKFDLIKRSGFDRRNPYIQNRPLFPNFARRRRNPEFCMTTQRRTKKWMSSMFCGPIKATVRLHQMHKKKKVNNQQGEAMQHFFRRRIEQLSERTEWTFNSYSPMAARAPFFWPPSFF